MSADPQTIIAASKCYQCIVNDGMFLPTLLYIISKSADGETVSTDPAVLVNDARCFACVVDGITPAAILEESVRFNQTL